MARTDGTLLEKQIVDLPIGPIRMQDPQIIDEVAHSPPANEVGGRLGHRE